jgi:beta-glucanase (GH16 family)
MTPSPTGAVETCVSCVTRFRRGLVAGLAVSGFALALAGTCAASDVRSPKAGMHLSFASNFDSFAASSTSESDWMTTGASGWRTLSDNKEAEYYSDASVGADPFSVRDGVLTITASRGTNPGSLPFNSGMLTTYRSFHQLFGYFEMRAELPIGTGLWPAFWLLPVDGGWPPEIDVMEQLGSDSRTIFVGTHSAVGGSNVGTTTAVHVTDTSGAFHRYGLDWEADTITWYFDDKPVFKEPTPADMHTPMYLLVNLAVGGRGSWPGPPTRATVFPARFKVDYLRAYSR